MSTDSDNHDDRPTTLAGGAQRALRAARAKAAADATPAVTEPAVEEPGDESAPDTSGTPDTPVDDTTDTTAEAVDDDTVEASKATAGAAISTDDETVRLSKSTVAAATSSDDEPPVVPTGRLRAAKVTRESRRPVDTRPTRRPVSRLTVVCSAVAVVALVFSVISATVWWRADHNADRTAALARDDVAVSARLAVATVNTSDYRQPANALTNWIAVSTGTLRGQFNDSRASATKLLGQAKTVTSAIVLDAAVTELNTGKGTATVLVSANVKRKPITGAATTSRNRFRATMVRVGGEWKLDDLKILPPQLL